MDKIPTTIVTGFLGSGKTTIISHLVKYLEKKGKKVVYIKNELGFDDLDTRLIQESSQTAETKELPMGCVYHTLVGPMSTAIDELIETHNPDRIIIETAGTEASADPLSLSIMVSNHPKLIKDGLITVIDVVNFKGYEDLDDYTKDKTNFVDLIVFNKVELVDQEKKEAVVGYVREFNEKSPIVEAHHGKLDPDLAFGMDFADHQANREQKFENGHINAFTYTSEKTFLKSKLENTFRNFPKTIIRFKGYIKTESGMEIVNGVYKRFDWISLAKDAVTDETELIIIGYKVKEDRAQISSMIDRCQVG